MVRGCLSIPRGATPAGLKVFASSVQPHEYDPLKSETTNQLDPLLLKVMHWYFIKWAAVRPSIVWPESGEIVTTPAPMFFTVIDPNVSTAEGSVWVVAEEEVTTTSELPMVPVAVVSVEDRKDRSKRRNCLKTSEFCASPAGGMMMGKLMPIYADALAVSGIFPPKIMLLMAI